MVKPKRPIKSKQIKNKDELELKRRRFANHLLNNGWVVNHGWIEKQAQAIRQEVNIDSDVWGKFDGDYHLISPCNRFTTRIEMERVSFWQKEPEWFLVTQQKIDSFTLVDGGIKFGIMEIKIN